MLNSIINQSNYFEWPSSEMASLIEQFLAKFLSLELSSAVFVSLLESSTSLSVNFDLLEWKKTSYNLPKKNKGKLIRNGQKN